MRTCSFSFIRHAAWIITLLFGLALLVATSVFAQTTTANIQMLPPVDPASSTAAACNDGLTPPSDRAMTWDGVNPIKCNGALKLNGNNASVTGSIAPGTTFITGNTCTQEGALGYDITNHTPVYCDQTFHWALSVAKDSFQIYLADLGLSQFPAIVQCTVAGYGPYGFTIRGAYGGQVFYGAVCTGTACVLAYSTSGAFNWVTGGSITCPGALALDGRRVQQ
jgi:hypothetical protein